MLIIWIVSNVCRFLYYYAGEASGSLHFKGKIPLYGAKVEDVSTVDFAVNTKDRVYEMTASTEQEKSSWIKFIGDQINVINLEVESIEIA